MTTSWLAGDDAIEAIVRGDEVTGDLAPLAAFARGVRAMGDEQAPSASAALAVLFVPNSADATVVASTTQASSLGRRSRMNGSGAATAFGKVAGLSLLAKIGLGTSMAAASVASAGAAGVLPEPATDAVRGAIEVVSPVEFDDSGSAGDHPDNFGGTVSDDATGESDGENGVDGQEIREQNPGADNRSSGSGQAPAAPPGQTGETGHDRAEDTPAGEYIPDDAGGGGGGNPSTPSATRPDPACGPTEHTVPSTVPPASNDKGNQPC